MDYSVLHDAIFTSHSGDARVGSGCHKSQGPSGQAIFANCSAEYGERTCRFYTRSNSIRCYLAMRDNGALETLAGPEKRWASDLEELRAPPSKGGPRIETLFKVTPDVACKGNTKCETGILSSVSNRNYVQITGNTQHKNLTKLYSPQGLEVRTGETKGVLQETGAVPPATDHEQRKGIGLSDFLRALFVPRCVPFTELTCRTRYLRASYPSQNLVRAGSKRK